MKCACERLSDGRIDMCYAHAEAVADAVRAERERIARWLDGQGQPGYAAEIRNLK